MPVSDVLSKTMRCQSTCFTWMQPWTLDYNKASYQPHINADLGGFGYSGVQQGYH